ncbi:MAG: DNA repair protein RadA [Thermodesulfovibrionales bacterium]|nr:DNA repair protein RadA [Thermodesulfovibrionales bacterium]
MSKIKISFVCQSCGYVSQKWLGKCPECASWNSFVEEKTTNKPLTSLSTSKPISLDTITSSFYKRIPTGIDEFDRVLGGGIVRGAIILIGGDPGIGKSTLLLQTMSHIGDKDKPVLYVSGEESPEQIHLRAERLNINSSGIVIYPETLVESIIEECLKIRPQCVVIDSIQTVYTQDLVSAPGSVGQIRESASKLMFFGKRQNIPVFIIGHVTKEGAIAGPRVLEHIVDTVLYFEGDSGHSYRILRTIKNRFGSTNEIGIFEMTDKGLDEVKNPSEILLSERPYGVSGSAVVSSMRGTRPLLVEIQALVSPTPFGIPRRTTVGIDQNRTNILLAVIEKRLGLQVGVMDIFINVAGGIKLQEPAVDLGVVSAVISSFKDTPIDADAIFIGEVGLSGEVRAVSQCDVRLNEALKVGFKKAYIPFGNKERLKGIEGIEANGIKRIDEILDIFA